MDQLEQERLKLEAERRPSIEAEQRERARGLGVGGATLCQSLLKKAATQAFTEVAERKDPKNSVGAEFTAIGPPA